HVGGVADEAVAERVPASDHFPLAPRQRPAKMIAQLVLGEAPHGWPLALPHRHHAALQRRRPDLLILMAGGFAPLLAAEHLADMAEEKLPAWVLCKPTLEDL